MLLLRSASASASASTFCFLLSAACFHLLTRPFAQNQTLSLCSILGYIHTSPDFQVHLRIYAPTHLHARWSCYCPRPRPQLDVYRLPRIHLLFVPSQPGAGCCVILACLYLSDFVARLPASGLPHRRSSPPHWWMSHPSITNHSGNGHL